MTAPYDFGEIIPYTIIATDIDDNPILTADMEIQHYRGSDGRYWNGAAWQVAIFNIAMTPDADTTNHRGLWQFDFDSGDALNELNDTYYSKMIDVSVGGNAKNAPFGQIETRVKSLNFPRLLHLMNQNTVTQATAISENGKMTQGDKYFYDTPENATLDVRTALGGLIGKNHIEAPLTVQGAFDKYTQIDEAI